MRELRSGGRDLASRAPTLLRSRRSEVLASLGEIIYELARSGELDLDDFPELAGAIGELEAIDNDLSGGFSGSFPSQFESDAEPVTARESVGVWRPNPDDFDEDGSPKGSAPVSARSSRPTRPVRRSGAGHIAFVPDGGDDGGDDEGDLEEYMHEDDVPSHD